jgi:hypothetical protein
MEIRLFRRLLTIFYSLNGGCLAFILFWFLLGQKGPSGTHIDAKYLDAIVFKTVADDMSEGGVFLLGGLIIVTVFLFILEKENEAFYIRVMGVVFFIVAAAFITASVFLFAQGVKMRDEKATVRIIRVKDAYVNRNGKMVRTLEDAGPYSNSRYRAYVIDLMGEEYARYDAEEYTVDPAVL